MQAGLSIGMLSADAVAAASVDTQRGEQEVLKKFQMEAVVCRKKAEVLIVANPAACGARSLWTAVLGGVPVWSAKAIITHNGPRTAYKPAIRIKRQIYMTQEFCEKFGQTTALLNHFGNSRASKWAFLDGQEEYLTAKDTVKTQRRLATVICLAAVAECEALRDAVRARCGGPLADKSAEDLAALDLGPDFCRRCNRSENACGGFLRDRASPLWEVWAGPGALGTRDEGVGCIAKPTNPSPHPPTRPPPTHTPLHSTPLPPAPPSQGRRSRPDSTLLKGWQGRRSRPDSKNRRPQIPQTNRSTDARRAPQPAILPFSGVHPLRRNSSLKLRICRPPRPLKSCLRKSPGALCF